MTPPKSSLVSFSCILMSLVIFNNASAQESVVKILQEGLDGYFGSQDAWINKRKSDHNYGGSRTLKYKSGRFFLLLKFPIFVSEGGPIPDGSEINSAVISLHKKSPFKYLMNAQRLLHDWNESNVNWNQRKLGVPWFKSGAKKKGQDVAASADGTSISNPNLDWVDIDVLSGVQLISKGEVENHGWIIKGESSRQGVAKFHSSEASKKNAELRPKLTISYIPPAPGRVNDTGVRACFDEQESYGCPFPNIPGQDGEYGRDVLYNDDSDGHAGFSFTKLDANGNVLPASAEEWSCVRDNVTNLIWEVKKEDGGLHDINNTYTWYHSGMSENIAIEYFDGNIQYLYDAGDCVGSRCDTEGFVDAVNASNLCGKHNWRMPTEFELFNLVDLGSSTDSGLDSRYFPSMQSLPNSVHNFTHFSSEGNGFFITAVDLSKVPTIIRSHTLAGATHPIVRLVSGQGSDLIESPLEINGNEVLDKRTGLIWRRCRLGFKWIATSGTCEIAEEYSYGSWIEAMIKTELLRQETGKNWRIPNIKELYSLRVFDASESVVDSYTLFRNFPTMFGPLGADDNYLSSNVMHNPGEVGIDAEYISIDVRHDTIMPSPLTASGPVLLVRDAQ